MTAPLSKRLNFNHATQTSLFLMWYVDTDCTQPERKKMDREMLAEWLRDIAQHIEEESSLIRDVSVDDALSDEGLTRKIITITFNAPGRAPQPEENVSDIHRH
ncbi:hypothetical protein E4Q46_21235 [Salmonella enterica]|uniref:Uncharacterized protein n=1 Tax=Salmonella enterica TaxID=28901 RepID=A0A742UJT2_SALER|nr:hypothetical protein [Salmonella enterica subsp. enterica serovar Enteritidis]EAQ3014284.1 hypothetical protein [Salmonella enterica]EBX8423469.1 hypothetical protein [Salmonella enterica subsp. enterica serovar Urbana]ECZ5203581.1 hypothetical protein [Salmonella enterica subsp. enterica serovar Kentucky]EDD6035976.1 hypothetical protein [Salmonella enterica subsp. enterica serovar Stanley]